MGTKQGGQTGGNPKVYTVTITLTPGPSHCLYKEKGRATKVSSLLFLSSVSLLLP